MFKPPFWVHYTEDISAIFPEKALIIPNNFKAFHTLKQKIRFERLYGTNLYPILCTLLIYSRTSGATFIFRFRLLMWLFTVLRE